MRKNIFVAAILFLIILIGCNPQVQAPPPSAPNVPQPTETIPPSQGNTETPMTSVAAPASPKGKIAFVRDCGGDLGWDIFTANADGSNIVDITNNPAKDMLPSWSPDGTKVVFESTRGWLGGGSIYTMDTSGENVKCLTTPETYCGNPAWSPDGKTIAYSTEKLGHGIDIFIMDIDGNNKTPVAPSAKTSTSGYTTQASPSWFPDSQKIAYTSNRLGVWEICEVTVGNPNSSLITADTSESKRYHICIKGECGLHSPILSVSPDGKFIVFNYGKQIGKQDIYLFSIETNELKCLTCELLNNSYFPTWSPDGSKIAFTYEIDGKPDIYIIDVDGSNPTLLIKDGMFPSWSR